MIALRSGTSSGMLAMRTTRCKTQSAPSLLIDFKLQSSNLLKKEGRDSRISSQLAVKKMKKKIK